MSVVDKIYKIWVETDDGRKKSKMKEEEATRIKQAWSNYINKPSGVELTQAADLVDEGFLKTVDHLCIESVDITNIQPDKLTKLVKIASKKIYIANSTVNLNIVLTNLQCRLLSISRLSLSTADTIQITGKMQQTLTELQLFNDVTLDIRQLSTYDGTKACQKIVLWYNSRDKYSSLMDKWAAQKGWSKNISGVRIK